MDPVSLTIGIIGLPVAIIGTVKLLRKTVQSIESAQPELLQLAKDTDLLAGVYDAFLDVLDAGQSSTAGASKIKRDLISWTKTLMRRIENLRHQVQAVDRNPEDYYSRIEVLTAHIIWMRSKNTIKYLRASINLARLSIVAFTNIRLIEQGNEELAHLRSALPLTEKHRIELKYGMSPEQRIEVVRNKIRNRHVQQHRIETEVEEVTVEVAAHEKKITNQSFIRQTQPLLQFKRSVNQYVTYVVLQEKADRRARRRHHGSSVLTSQSTATTQTQSTQPSFHQVPAPESPPTSPEPSIADPGIEIQPEKEEAISILNFCQRCSGTCTNTEAHNTSIRQPPPDPRPHTMGYIPSTAPGSFSIQENTITGSSASARPWMSRVYQTQPSSSEDIPASDSYPNTHQRHPPQPSVEPADEAKEISHIDPATSEGDEDDFQDGAPEESTSTEEEARGLGTSIWKATGGFAGDMPKGLRIRRQRSRSPQDFW